MKINNILNLRSRGTGFLVNITVLLLVGGCSVLGRHTDSGYAQPKPSGKVIRSNGQKTSQDIYSSSRRSAPLSDQRRLQSLENTLNTRKEVEQYSKMLPWFKDDQERIEFLSQGNFEDKQRWLNEQNFLSRPQQIMGDMKELVEAQDITLGMPQTLVKKSWGDPDVIEVSGNPQFRNERWRYNKYISTSDGYKSEKKVVYFEGGKVVGWELE
jgi:hypothetical protein